MVVASSAAGPKPQKKLRRWVRALGTLLIGILTIWITDLVTGAYIWSAIQAFRSFLLNTALQIPFWVLVVSLSAVFLVLMGIFLWFVADESELREHRRKLKAKLVDVRKNRDYYKWRNKVNHSGRVYLEESIDAYLRGDISRDELRDRRHNQVIDASP